MSSSINRGDLLFYFRSEGGKLNFFRSEIIKLGEILEDGVQKKEYYHVAIALSDSEKIEADSQKVAIHPIVFDECFDVVHLPFEEKKIEQALQKVIALQGEEYDNLLIFDEGLRILTDETIQLPKAFVEDSERHKKICSTLAKVYLNVLGISVKGFPSPEDIYLAVSKKLN